MIFHLLNLAVVNAWLEYRKDTERLLIVSTKQLDLLDFTLVVIAALSDAESKPVTPKRLRPLASPLQPANRVDQVGQWPLHDESREQCTEKTRAMCEKRKVHLCLTKSRSCFKVFHTSN
ncbi:hypothetical protein HPB48_010377 [Haemaphysalis longicornis]|uniref:PiggyBac transposable element-derived protein domain-containing protein n=1 Tax=Haemaphysalis longicornis TaxID=44386 RepID=A0A9J6GM26_HAELO|nr:hypothetical protein HPB48_010377 [Haemaphysalis longicornis]